MSLPTHRLHIIPAGINRYPSVRNGPKSIGRGDRIRTCDIYVPNVALYQSELHPGFAEAR
jgi:hypothetical protein